MKYISKVLLYNINEDRTNLIKGFFDENKIEYINVKKQDYLKSIASLLEIEGFNSNHQIFIGKAFEDEMAVLFNFDDELLDNFLDYFKVNKIPSIKLKAICTPTNATWNSIELHDELVKEAKSFEKKK